MFRKGVFGRDFKPVVVNRFGEVFIGPHFDALHSLTDIIGCGNHDNRNLKAVLFHVRKYIDTVFPRHIDIEQKQVHLIVLQEPDACIAVIGCNVFITETLDDMTDEGAHNSTVIGYQDGCICSFAVHQRGAVEIILFSI